MFPIIAKKGNGVSIHDIKSLNAQHDRYSQHDCPGLWDQHVGTERHPSVAVSLFQYCLHQRWTLVIDLVFIFICVWHRWHSWKYVWLCPWKFEKSLTNKCTDCVSEPLRKTLRDSLSSRDYTMVSLTPDLTSDTFKRSNFRFRSAAIAILWCVRYYYLQQYIQRP